MIKFFMFLFFYISFFYTHAQYKRPEITPISTNKLWYKKGEHVLIKIYNCNTKPIQFYSKFGFISLNIEYFDKERWNIINIHYANQNQSPFILLPIGDYKFYTWDQRISGGKENNMTAKLGRYRIVLIYWINCSENRPIPGAKLQNELYNPFHTVYSTEFEVN